MSVMAARTFDEHKKSKELQGCFLEKSDLLIMKKLQITYSGISAQKVKELPQFVTTPQ